MGFEVWRGVLTGGGAACWFGWGARPENHQTDAAAPIRTTAAATTVTMILARLLGCPEGWPGECRGAVSEGLLSWPGTGDAIVGVCLLRGGVVRGRLLGQLCLLGC